MWAAFDRLLLMAPGGHVAYHGDKDAAAAHFGALGFPLPPQWSPPDHFIELVSAAEGGGDEGGEAGGSQTRDAVVAAWAAQPPPAAPPVGPALVPRGATPLLVAIPALWRRQLRQVWRVYLKPFEWLLTLALAALFGTLWWRVGAQRDEPLRQPDYVSIIFFFVAQWSWAPLFAVLNTFPDERDVLTRERASDSYSIAAWYLAKLAAELPLSWPLPAGFFAVTYPLAAMPTASAPMLFLIILLNAEVAASAGACLSAACFDREKAITAAIVYMCFMMCTGGYVGIDLRTAPATS